MPASPKAEDTAQTQKAQPQHWLIAGGTGFIGSALAEALIARGDKVTIWSRSEEKAKNLFGKNAEIVTDLDTIPATTRVDRLVNLAGEPLAGGRWTDARKKRFFTSRVGTASELNQLAARLDKKPALLISGSAIGYYGNQPEGDCTEGTAAGNDFMASICTAWEDEATKARGHVDRLIFLRTGIVLDPDGGLLPPLALSARFGLATVLGSGKQWMSWITLDDIIRLILFAADTTTVEGPLNATAPEPERQRDFQKKLAHSLNRPQFMWMPVTPLKLMLGQMSDLMLTGQRVIPTAAQHAGFQFLHPDLETAFNTLF